MTSGELTGKLHADLKAMLVGQGAGWVSAVLEQNPWLPAARANERRSGGGRGGAAVERQLARVSGRHLQTLLGRVPVARLDYAVAMGKRTLVLRITSLAAIV